MFASAVAWPTGLGTGWIHVAFYIEMKGVPCGFLEFGGFVYILPLLSHRIPSRSGPGRIVKRMCIFASAAAWPTGLVIGWIHVAFYIEMKEELWPFLELCCFGYILPLLSQGDRPGSLPARAGRELEHICIFASAVAWPTGLVISWIHVAFYIEMKGGTMCFFEFRGFVCILPLLSPGRLAWGLAGFM